MRRLMVPDLEQRLLLDRGHAGIQRSGYLIVEGRFELLQHVGVVEHRRVAAAERHIAIRSHRIVAASEADDPQGHARPLEEGAAARDARELREERQLRRARLRTWVHARSLPMEEDPAV